MQSTDIIDPIKTVPLKTISIQVDGKSAWADFKRNSPTRDTIEGEKEIPKKKKTDERFLAQILKKNLEIVSILIAIKYLGLPALSKYFLLLFNYWNEYLKKILSNHRVIKL